MKTVLKCIRNMMLYTLAALCMIGCFLGAVLQESYKLDPVTQEEIAEVTDVQS